MTKIKEIILEPANIHAGTTFKIKVKAVRGLTYKEMKSIKVKKAKEYTCIEIKGG